MYEIDSPGSVSGQWVNKNVGGGIAGTETDDEWFNTVQSELINFHEAFGFAKAKGPNDLMLQAMFSQTTVGGQTIINFVADSDYTINSASDEQKDAIFVFTDTGVVLTGTTNVIVPDEVRLYLFENQTAETLVIKTVAGNGLQLKVGQRLSFYCDGVDVLGNQVGAIAPDKSQRPTIANGADADHDIDFTPGKILSKDGKTIISLDSLLTKQLDAAWVSGTNSGGIFAGSIDVDETYHCFVIVKDSDGSTDAGFDIDLTAVNIPAGYTVERRVGSCFTDSAANIIGFVQTGSDLEIKTPIQDFTSGVGSTAGSNLVLSVPKGLSHIKALCSFSMQSSSSANAYLQSTLADNNTPGSSNRDLFSAAAGELSQVSKLVPVNSNGEVFLRNQAITGNISIITKMWVDELID